MQAIDPKIGAVLAANLTFNRQLDIRNVQPGSLGADFNRFDFAFWTAVKNQDTRNAARQGKLEQLNEWRNAIAHHNVETRRSTLVPGEVTLPACRSWRSALDGLAASFDRVLADQLATLLGPRPW